MEQVKDLINHFTKNDTITNEHMKRFSASLVIRKMQIKTIMKVRHSDTHL
jgi:hypothetical protein